MKRKFGFLHLDLINNLALDYLALMKINKPNEKQIQWMEEIIKVQIHTESKPWNKFQIFINP